MKHRSSRRSLHLEPLEDRALLSVDGLGSSESHHHGLADTPDVLVAQYAVANADVQPGHPASVVVDPFARRHARPRHSAHHPRPSKHHHKGKGGSKGTVAQPAIVGTYTGSYTATYVTNSNQDSPISGQLTLTISYYDPASGVISGTIAYTGVPGYSTTSGQFSNTASPGGGAGTSLSLLAQLPAVDDETPTLFVVGVFDGSNSIDVSRFGGGLPTFEGHSITLTRSG